MTDLLPAQSRKLDSGRKTGRIGAGFDSMELNVRAMRFGNAWCFGNNQRFDLATVAFSQQGFQWRERRELPHENGTHPFFFDLASGVLYLLSTSIELQELHERQSNEISKRRTTTCRP